MEGKVFAVTIKGNHRLGTNAYVRGVIRGIGYAMCSGEPDWGRATKLDEITGNATLYFDCTEDQFKEFEKVAKELYPNLCEFGYVDEKDATKKVHFK